MGSLHFEDRPVTWRVGDAADIPEPKENEYLHLAYFADVFAMRRLERVMEMRPATSAANTNALDEVPDSTWFQNRIGRGPMTAASIRSGPGVGAPRMPIRVVGAKSGGGNAGFIVEDARAQRFLLKFDHPENPGMQTAAGAIVGRLFWAMGYNVPSDNVLVVRRDELTIDPHATWKDGGVERPFGPAQLDRALATSPQLPDGSFRALASALLPGKPKGGVSPEGLRDDDPNDRVPHQHRRELRGLRTFAAWLGHTDMKQDNTLDMYVEEGGRRFLRHYLIDFGEALGGHAGEKDRDEDGYENTWDWENQGKAAVSFGLWRRPWEGRVKTPWPAIGSFGANDFDPRLWREAYPYFPFLEADAADAYWAAKIVMRFERAHLVAAVAAGRLEDPAAERYLVDTLVARQRKVGRVYLEAVTPLDDFAVRGRTLCARDLGVVYGFATTGVVERLDDGARVVARATVDRDGSVCVSLPADDEYQVVRLQIRRGRELRPPMQVHLRGGDAPRVLGIVRTE